MPNAMIVGMVIGLLSSGFIVAQTSEGQSQAVFSSPAAKEAQDAYNKAVQTAWLAYQEQVRRAAQAYVEALRQVFTTAMKAEKLEEALLIKKEIEAYQFDVKAGLVVYYDFDQTPAGGVVKDASGQNNHGKIIGAKWESAGRFGGAIKFTIANKTDAVIVPDSDSLDVKRVSISVWIKTTANDEYWNRIIDKDYRNGYNLCIGGDVQKKQFRDKAVFECNGKAVTSDGSVIDGQWHHIVAIYDGSEMRMFVDGRKQKAVSKWTGEITSNKYDMAVGNSKIPYEPWEFLAFDGLIDELRIYNRPLSDKEIQLLFVSQGK
jgi:hypothetical protein